MVPTQQCTLYCPTGWGAPLLRQKTSTYSFLSIPSLSWLRLCSLCTLQPGAPLQGCPMGCIPMGCIPVACILMEGCPMGMHPNGSHPDGLHPDGMYPGGVHPAGRFILVGFILSGFILLYVRLWQTGGDVVLQDSSFQPQKAGCCQKSTLGVSLAHVPPKEAFENKGERCRDEPKLSPSL